MNQPEIQTHWQLPGSETEWGTIAMAAMVFCLYLFHFVRSYQVWRRERRGRSFRGFLLALVVQIGMTQILLGPILAATAPTDFRETVGLFMSSVLRGALIAGGFWLMVSWLKDPVIFDAPPNELEETEEEAPVG